MRFSHLPPICPEGCCRVKVPGQRQFWISKPLPSLAVEWQRYWGFWGPGLTAAPSGAAGSFGFQNLANRLPGGQPDPQGYHCFWVAAGQTSATLSYRVGYKVIQVITESDMFLGKKRRSLSLCDFPTTTARPEQDFVVITVLSLLDKDNCHFLQRTKHGKYLFFICVAGGFCKYKKIT